MKHIFSIFVSLCIVMELQAQVLKTVELTPGNLSSLLTKEEKNSITNLIITGSMDARDFKVMRDSLPMLSVLDIREVKIDAYLDSTNSNWIHYQEDCIPNSMEGIHVTDFSLSGLTNLTSVILPESLRAIGYRAFKGCTGLNSMNVPFLVDYLHDEAFMNCSGIASITLPSTVSTIGKSLFSGCSSLISVELPSNFKGGLWATFENCISLESITLPSSITDLGEAAFAGCSSLKSIVVPPSVTIIGDRTFENCSSLSLVVIPSTVSRIRSQAFKGCLSLTTMTIPESVLSIYDEAFMGCINLESIYSLAIDPPYLSNTGEGVFEEANTLNCKLFVPFGYKDIYKETKPWNDFQNMIEMPGISLSDSLLIMGWAGESQATTQLKTNSNIPWSISSTQKWLTVSPASGSGSQTITLTAAENITQATRTNLITINGDIVSINIVCLQQAHETNPQTEKTVYVNSGNLDLILSEEEKSTLTKLTLIGTIDARDIITTADMPLLTELDLTLTTITAISLSPGYYYSNSIGTYEVNPRETGSLFSSRLRSLHLPSNLENIGTGALKDCKSLISIEIPSSVTSIGFSAFSGCSGLTSLNIPPSVVHISEYSFSYCSGLKDLTISPSLISIPSRAFLGCSALTTVTIPSSVKYIGNSAFLGCSELTTLILPASLWSIDNIAFWQCPKLQSIYSYNPIPPAADFEDIDTTKCTVYVPFGSKELYKATDEWKEFTRIVEMSLFKLSAINICIESKPFTAGKVELITDLSWEASSDQPWLTLDKISGTGNQTLTFTAEENTSKVSRIAIVTVSVSGGYTQSITVKQQANYSNQKPFAHAGEDQMAEEGSIVTLDGSASLDEDEDKLTYMWIAPAGIILNSEIIARPTFIAPKVIEDTSYRFSLVVIDGKEVSSSDEVIVTVKKTNMTPIANAGEDQIVIEGSIVTLDGSASLDEDEDNLTYMWSPPDGITLSSASDVQPTFIAPKVAKDTAYIFKLVVKDGTEISLSDEVIVTVKKTNIAPVAHAGEDQSVMEGSVVTLDGSSSKDTDRDAISFLWSAPEGIKLSSVTEAKPTFTAPDINSTTQYPFTLVVSDGKVNSPPDQVVITSHPMLTELVLSQSYDTIEAKQGSTVMIVLRSNTSWTATSDQPWLAVRPNSGSGSQTILFTANANTDDSSRVAIVTFSASGTDAKTIAVIQREIATEVAEMAQNRPSVSCYPNPFTEKITVEIVNPKQEKMTVDIYNLAGKRVRNLTLNNWAEKITLSWNGTNEQGKQMPEGMYLLKVNEQTRKVMKK